MSWQIYTERDAPLTELSELAPWLDKAPPWRAPPRGSVLIPREAPPLRPREVERGAKHVTLNGSRELTAINTALMLRRPLLVMGDPGIGKSSLAYAIAWSLGLGRPLRWEISSRTALQDGLYDYDAVSHLRAGGDSVPIQRFITLGPLGTALLPTVRPRVLLIDELDKSSYDLPNDLLHVFEEGAFEIRELIRAHHQTEGSASITPVEVMPFDYEPGGADRLVPIIGGRVRTHHHPVVVITTNDEREFTEAFRRRCVPLRLTLPDLTEEGGRALMAKIITAHLGGDEQISALLDEYSEENTDVLLQALFMWQVGASGGREGALHEVLARKGRDG